VKHSKVRQALVLLIVFLVVVWAVTTLF